MVHSGTTCLGLIGLGTHYCDTEIASLFTTSDKSSS